MAELSPRKILQLRPPQRIEGLGVDGSQRAALEARKDGTHPGKCTHPEKHNPNKFYLYHRDHGHDTKKCIQLRDEIEELIRRGRLDRFIRRRPEGRKDRSRALLQPEPPRREEQPEDRPSIGIINSISGGPDGEQTFHGCRVQKIYECITNDFALNENFFHIYVFFLLA